MNNEDIHIGHRARMAERVLKDGYMSDHELLETLLFYFIPRKDTNELAHRLIRTFGSLKRIFSATGDELLAIEGVGKSVATGILTLGKIFNRVTEEKEDFNFLSSLEKLQKVVKRDFVDLKDEKFIVYLLSEKQKELMHIVFEDKSKKAVGANVPEILKGFAIHKPKYVIIIHNHPSGLAIPSNADDFATKKMNILCELHGVTLMEHLIVADGSSYSYYSEGRLDYIKEKADLGKLIEDIKGE